MATRTQLSFATCNLFNLNEPGLPIVPLSCALSGRGGSTTASAAQTTTANMVAAAAIQAAQRLIHKL